MEPAVTEKPANRSGRTKPLLWVAAIALLLGALHYLDVQKHLRTALAWIDGLGPLGPLVFILVYVLACILFVPGSVLTLGGGAIFGLLKGALAVWVGAVVGATAAFLVGRYLARDWVAQKIEGNLRFRAVDEAIAREGWKIVGLVRLSPVFPFNLLNYALGLTRVPLRDYVLASAVGMIPGTLMYVYIGSLAGDLASVGAGGRARTTAEWALYAVGLLATVAVTVYVTRVARAALEERIH